MNDAPSQSQDKFIVRLPDGMRDRIKAAAEFNGRSMNAEIVAALEAAFRPRRTEPMTRGELRAIVDNMARTLNEMAQIAYTDDQSKPDPGKDDSEAH